mmetsp:Transcript_3456/g.4632  ORF Transcript_3456/g.4632 Transcript_3456/m.4632 type:complete len:315 (-) Transcript_3456:452-1396(-)
MSCQTIWPLPECGIAGECKKAEINGTMETFCECTTSFLQSFEMNFFVELDEFQTSVCYHNNTFINALYGILLAACVLHTLLLCYRMRHKKIIYGKKSWWFWFTGSMFFVSVYRLVNSEAIMAIDIWTTSFVAFCLPFNLCVKVNMLHNHLSKLAEYVENAIGKTTYFDMARTERKTLRWMYVVAGFVINNLWIVTMVGNKISIILVRVEFAFLIVLILVQSIFYGKVIAELEKDLNLCTQSSVSKSTSDLQKIVTESIPTLRKMHRALVPPAFFSGSALCDWTFLRCLDLVLELFYTHHFYGHVCRKLFPSGSS